MRRQTPTPLHSIKLHDVHVRENKSCLQVPFLPQVTLLQDILFQILNFLPVPNFKIRTLTSSAQVGFLGVEIWRLVWVPMKRHPLLQCVTKGIATRVIRRRLLFGLVEEEGHCQPRPVYQVSRRSFVICQWLDPRLCCGHCSPELWSCDRCF